MNGSRHSSSLPCCLARSVGIAALVLSLSTSAVAAGQMSDTASERYQIVKGDTLWDISKRFFGDGMSWPKLYEWNKDTISDPERIYPGKWLVYMPGTGTSLPQLTDQTTPLAAVPGDSLDVASGDSADSPDSTDADTEL